MALRIVSDDFGMSEDINSAISELVRKKIVSKISVMAGGTSGLSSADLGHEAETGLHLNLTLLLNRREEAQETILSFSKLLFLAFTGRLDAGMIRESLDRQYAMLESAGFKFSYVDTHQHIHIIPSIMKSIISFAKDKNIRSIRCITIDGSHAFFYFRALARHGFAGQIPKMILLYSFGILMRRRLDKEGIRYSRNLILMPLAVGGDYFGLLNSYISRFKDEDAEIVTHPGLRPERPGPDGYSDGRYVEYSSLIKLA